MIACMLALLSAWAQEDSEELPELEAPEDPEVDSDAEARQLPPELSDEELLALGEDLEPAEDAEELDAEELDEEVPAGSTLTLEQLRADPVIARRAKRLEKIALAEARERKIRVLPMRFDIGTAFRDELAPAAVMGLGVQLARSERFALEANVAFLPLHAFQYAGPWRRMAAWDFTADGTWLANRWLAIGPTVGVDYRMFNQQDSAIEQMFVPLAGVRLNTAFIKARTWSFAITTRLTSDLSQTRIVLETNEVRLLPTIEGQIGLRFNLGHGRSERKQ